MIFTKFIKNFIIIGNILAFSFLLATVINSYIALKNFKLAENITIKKKTNNYNTVKKVSYKFIDEIFLNLNNVNINRKTSTTQKNNPPQKYVQILTNAKLIGTLIFNKKRLALIEYNGKKNLVKEGDFLQGYKVIKVEKYKVTLGKNGNLYQISLKSRNYLNNNISRKYKKFYQPTYQEKSVIKISKSIVEKETADIGNLLKDVRLIPLVRNGETIGFKFVYINPTSPLYKYGLRSGDIIKSVNGMPIRTAEEAFKIYNMLRNEKRIEIEVERRGKRKVIVYEIQ